MSDTMTATEAKTPIMTPTRIAKTEHMLSIIMWIIVGITFVIIALTSIAPTLSMSTDMFYLIAGGQKILATGRIPDTWSNAYMTLPDVWQNWLTAITYATEYNIGSIFGKGVLAVRLGHIIEIAVMIAVTKYITNRHNTKPETAPLACLILLSQYSICQTRSHVVCAITMLIYMHQLVQIRDGGKNIAAHIAFAVMSSIVYANVQRTTAILLPAITLPMVLFDIQNKDANLRLMATAALTLLAQIVIAPPGTGSMFSGILFTNNEGIKNYINETVAVLKPARPFAKGPELDTEIVAVIATLLCATHPRKHTNPPSTAFMFCTLIGLVATFVIAARLQQPTIVFAAATIIFENDDPPHDSLNEHAKEIAKAFAFVLIAAIIPLMTNTKTAIDNVQNMNLIIQEDSLTQARNYPRKETLQGLKDKRVLCVTSIGSMIRLEDALPITDTKFEALTQDKAIDKTVCKLIELTLTKTENMSIEKLPQTDNITNFVFDSIILPKNEKTWLESRLANNEHWKNVTPDNEKNYVRYDNVDGTTFEEQGLAEAA